MKIGQASCWICLEGGQDESGQPLRRDCSCRGNAGFAHVSCIIKFAEVKCKEITEYEAGVFDDPWTICHHCKQPYQNDLALDVSAACVPFAEKTYGCHVYHNGQFTNRCKILGAITLRVESIISNHKVDDYSLRTLEDGMRHVEKSHSMIEQMINDNDMTDWVHMPKTRYEFLACQFLRVEFESLGYTQMARLLICRTLVNGQPMGKSTIARIIECYLKARTIYNLFGMKKAVLTVDMHIAAFEEAAGVKAEDPKISLERSRALYENSIRCVGKESETTIKLGLNLGSALAKYNRTIEAKRLVTKLAATCRRINGSGHKLTIEATEKLDNLR